MEFLQCTHSLTRAHSECVCVSVHSCTKMTCLHTWQLLFEFLHLQLYQRKNSSRCYYHTTTQMHEIDMCLDAFIPRVLFYECMFLDKD